MRTPEKLHYVRKRELDVLPPYGTYVLRYIMEIRDLLDDTAWNLLLHKPVCYVLNLLVGTYAAVQCLNHLVQFQLPSRCRIGAGH